MRLFNLKFVGLSARNTIILFSSTKEFKSIYINEASETPTIFHVSTILKKKKTEKKCNKTFLNLMLCLSMLCLLFPTFLYQLLLDQTHGKPIAKHCIA